MTDAADQPTTFDVVGIGNALVDVLTHETDDFLASNGLVKGSMTLIDTGRAEELYSAMGPGIEVSGGSAANTIAGVASFGGQAAYIGRVFDDELGTVFAHDMRACGVVYRAAPAVEGPPTGRCLIVVTPDAQRTMNTYLGSSEFFGPEHVDSELIADAQVTFLEGYLFDRPEAKEAYWKASRVAHDAGRRVALTLSDTFCVERHREAWRDLVADQVDILFANEAEALSLYEVDTFEEALAAVPSRCRGGRHHTRPGRLGRGPWRRRRRGRRPPGGRGRHDRGRGPLRRPASCSGSPTTGRCPSAGAWVRSPHPRSSDTPVPAPACPSPSSSGPSASERQ